MTTTTAPAARLDAVEADHVAVRRALPVVGVLTVAAVVALGWLFANSLAESITDTVGGVVVGALMFALVVPRALRRPSAGPLALVLAIVALLSVAVFYLHLPLLLGVPAVLLGAAGRHAARGAGTAIAALVVGVLAIVGDAAMYVLNAVLGG